MIQGCMVRSYEGRPLTLRVGDIHFWKKPVHDLQSQPDILACLKRWLTSDAGKCETLIWNTSLPYKCSAQSPFQVIDAAGIGISRLISIGGNCASIIESLLLAAHEANYGDQPPIICADHFGIIAGNYLGPLKDGLDQWQNGVSIMSPRGTAKKLDIVRFASRTEPGFHGMLTVSCSDGVDYLNSIAEDRARFRLDDINNEVGVINAVVDQTVDVRNCLLVVINRAADRTKALQDRLSIDSENIFSSRAVIGHTGGSDMFYNLSMAMKTKPSRGQYIILSANGLGYQWSAVLLRVN